MDALSYIPKPKIVIHQYKFYVKGTKTKIIKRASQGGLILILVLIHTGVSTKITRGKREPTVDYRYNTFCVYTTYLKYNIIWVGGTAKRQGN